VTSVNADTIARQRHYGKLIRRRQKVPAVNRKLICNCMFIEIFSLFLLSLYSLQHVEQHRRPHQRPCVLTYRSML